MKKLNLIGQIYGSLKVVDELAQAAGYKRRFLCLCKCGKTTEVGMSHLRSGHTTSCGCYQKQFPNRLKHGESNRQRTKLYHVWGSMIQRCHNLYSTGYPKYGAKGVKVCEVWHDYVEFSTWARKKGYKEGLTIERRNPYLGYSPDNCLWVPMAKQGINRRTTSSNTSGYTGVTFHKHSGRWCSRITVDGVRIHIGRFSSPEEANEARYAYILSHNLTEHLAAYGYQRQNS